MTLDAHSTTLPQINAIESSGDRGSRANFLNRLSVGATPAVFGIVDPTLSAAVVAAIVAGATAFFTSVASSPLRYLVDSRLHRARARTDYEYDQRKRLRAEIGSYHGRLLEAALPLHYRLNQIYAKRHERWLHVDGDYTKRWPRHHFFNSTVYRFMAFVALANRFEREALYIDSRIAENTDRLFLFYVKALRWTLTDAALFDGLGYSDASPTDHFYTDHLRRMCASVWKEDGTGLVDLRAFEDLLDELTLEKQRNVVDRLRETTRVIRRAPPRTRAADHELDAVLRFFDGLDPDDKTRPRWDRLMAFQLVLIAFIQTFGYEINRSEAKWFDAVAGRMRPEVATNLCDWLPKLGVGDGSFLRGRDPGGRTALRSLKKRALPHHRNRLRDQAALPAGADPQG